MTQPSERGPIVVAAAVDEAYLPFALIVADSIARRARRDRPVQFHVLYDGPDHWAVEAIDAYRKGPVRGYVHRLRNPFESLGAINGFPPSTFFRHAIPAVLQEHRRAVYLDVDVIVESDIGELFDVDLQGRAIGGATCTSTVIDALLCPPDDPLPGRRLAWRKYFREELGRKTDEEFLDFIQAGVMVFDLDMQRAMKLDQQLLDTAQVYRDRIFHAGQGVLNKLLIGQMTRLDPRWNRTGISLYRSTERRAPQLMKAHARRQRRTRGILHFGGPKPWGEYLIKGSASWWWMALRSPARNFVIDKVVRTERARLYHYLYHQQPWVLRLGRMLRRRLGAR